MRRKVTYIISDVDRALAFEWIAGQLDTRRFELSFVLIRPGSSELQRYLENHRIPVLLIESGGKKDWPAAWWKLYRYLRVNQPDIVHCHLLQACILGLTAAWFAGIRQRIYTRHHSSLHHVYFPKGVWWDKLFNRVATKIIAISKPVKEILVEWEKAPEEKVVLIPHGFKLEAYSDPESATLSLLKALYNPEGKSPVIGVVSRFTEWKGVQYIIPAFRRILDRYPDALLLLFNAEGDYSKEINKVLDRLPEGSYKTIKFEKEMAAAWHLFDVFVHTPIDYHSEAFGQIYIEAMAAGIPMVATRSGIGVDILKHEFNALVVPYQDPDAIEQAMLQLLDSQALRDQMIANGRVTARQFELNFMMQRLEKLYES